MCWLWHYVGKLLSPLKYSLLTQQKGWKKKVKVEVTQSCPTLWDPMGYTVHGILQARILEWVAFPFSRGSSWPRDQTQVSCIAGSFFTSWATRKAQEYWSGVAYPFPSGSSQPRNRTGVSCIAGRSLPTELSGKPRLWSDYHNSADYHIHCLT